MRSPVAVVLLFAVLAFSAFAATPEASLDLGLRAFRAGDYASAAVDLSAAAVITPEQLRAFVETGRLEQLQTYETALVYLALTRFRMGREDDARDAILRIAAAERLLPTYANLPLQSDAAEFETLAAALASEAKLPRNVQLAAADPSSPLPPVRPAADGDAPQVTMTIEQRQSVAEAFTTFERERMQTGQLVMPTIAQETQPRVEEAAAVRADADRRIAEAEAEAARRVAAAEQEAQRRIAAAEAEAERARREAAATTEAPRPVETARPAEQTARVALDASAHRADLMTLRQADALASNGLTFDANELYTRLAMSANLPREILAEAAIGLYRTGAYRDAVRAFQRFGTFARGEEDLRYYYAVSLYEIGDMRAAQKELACALPFIESTDEVQRYQMRIEQTSAAQQAARMW